MCITYSKLHSRRVYQADWLGKFRNSYWIYGFSAIPVSVYVVGHTEVINLLMNADILLEWKHRLALIFFILEILWQVLGSPNLEDYEISNHVNMALFDILFFNC